MNKLIVLEGPDGIGKSTQATILKELFDLKQIVQPNGSGIVGFLREQVKNNPSYKPFERQLLHTISHIVDAYTEFPPKPYFQTTSRFSHRLELKILDSFIMDRCHASTYAYGKVQKMADSEIDLLMRVHQEVYKENIGENYEPYIIFLDSFKPHKDEKTDEFEKTFSWEELKWIYRGLAEKLERKEMFLFHPDEKVLTLDVANQTKEQVTSKILSFIDMGF
jgi:thymidylate kinase